MPGFSKYQILKATYRVAERPIVASYLSTAPAEVQAQRAGTIWITRPIDANETHIEERNIAASAVTCHEQF